MEDPVKNTSNANAYAPLLMLPAVLSVLLVAVMPAVNDGNVAAIAAMIGIFLVQFAALVVMGALLGNHLRQRKGGERDA